MKKDEYNIRKKCENWHASLTQDVYCPVYTHFPSNMTQTQYLETLLRLISTSFFFFLLSLRGLLFLTEVGAYEETYTQQ